VINIAIGKPLAPGLDQAALLALCGRPGQTAQQGSEAVDKFVDIVFWSRCFRRSAERNALHCHSFVPVSWRKATEQ